MVYFSQNKQGIDMAGRGRKTIAQKIEANKAEQIKCEERLAQLKEEEKSLFYRWLKNPVFLLKRQSKQFKVSAR